MSRALEPLTVGYDWEMAVLKRTGENVGSDEVEALADQLRGRMPWSQVGTDLELIESRVGSARSFRELLDRSRRFEREFRRTVEKHGWSILRSGTRPFEREPVGAHVHVGTLRDSEAAFRIQIGMAPYVAPLAALMANSPIYRGRTGEYKSYRVASFAEWCSTPYSIVEPAFAQIDWGGDVCPKIAWGSTVELRVGDGVSSTRLMCEAATLAAGLMYHVVERCEGTELSEDDYDALLVNRWRAAKHGLQATFRWRGDEVTAQRVLTEMVVLAEDGMALLGAGPDDLRVVRSMIEKRQTQADFQLAVYAKERGDAHRFTRTFANIQRDPGAFEKYLEMAPALPALPPADYEKDLMSCIEVETPYTVLVRTTPLSPALLDRLLARFVDSGYVTLSRSQLGVRLYTRTDLVGGSRRRAGAVRSRA